MPHLEHGDVSLHYEVFGEGFPLLLFAPGGMRSRIEAWRTGPADPIATLSPHFRVIAMDQRNAGRSRAPVTADDGWHSYTGDHLALLDHLGVERCHVLGRCIGGPYSLGLIEAAPERVTAAVLQQPIGLSAENRSAFHAMFDAWAKDLVKRRPEVEEASLSRFRSNMYDGEFVFNVSRSFVQACQTPMLVLMGDDLYHPQETSRDLVALAPRAELIERWKQPDAEADAVARVLAFLQEHTPTQG